MGSSRESSHSTWLQISDETNYRALPVVWLFHRWKEIADVRKETNKDILLVLILVFSAQDTPEHDQPRIAHTIAQPG